jgi:AP-2 complex subunit alpha
MAMFSARGLNNFISELRACSSREEEQRRVDKELVKIRQKFTQTQTLQSYDKKKYAWKLIYIFMLGYDIDFGHMQVINLVSGTKYSEKCLGYLGCSILLKSSDELMTLVVNSIRNDLKSPEASHQCLALCCVANLGGSEFSEALSPDVVSLFMSSSSIAHVRKKAALCVRRLLPPNPELIPLDNLESRIRTLMAEPHLGVVTSTASLLQTALTLHPTHFRSVLDVILSRLGSLVQQKACPRDYMYYNTPCPWLQVKLLRLLQQYGPLEDPGQRAQLHDTLHRILARPAPGKGAKNNAAYAVLIEAVNLVIAQGRKAFAATGETSSDDKGSKLADLAVQLLARFIAVSEPNIRYIGLDSMHRLVRREGESASAAIRAHQETVLFSLKDADNSVRRRALDLLFSMCDADSARKIVGELVTYLAVAEGAIREELVLKTAILAEKYATDLRWYVDTVLQLITIAGSEVPDDVWHRVVQIVTNREELQPYAAEAMFRALEPKHVDETTAKFGAYVLGEFGYLLADRAGMSSVEQFDVLHRHYSGGVASVATKSLILTALVKMGNLFDELRPRVLEVFKKGATHMDLELQQRACEYLALHHVDGDSELMKRVLEPMPVFPENRESALIVRLRNQQKVAEGGSENITAASGDDDDDLETPDPASSARGGEIDLLSLDSPPKVAKPGFGGVSGGAEAIRGANPVADLVDVFGGGGGSAAGLDASFTPKLREWSRALMLAPQGVLMENEVLQIGAKHEYRGSQGRVQLFFGNKTNDALADFKVQADGGASFRMQSEEVPADVAPKQQVKQQIMLEAMAPFTSPPALTVSFIRAGTRCSYALTLPAQATNFMEPVPLGGEDFMKRWSALEGQDREQMEVVTAAGKMDMEQTRKWLAESLKLAVVEVRPPMVMQRMDCGGN